VQNAQQHLCARVVVPFCIPGWVLAASLQGLSCVSEAADSSSRGIGASSKWPAAARRPSLLPPPSDDRLSAELSLSHASHSSPSSVALLALLLVLQAEPPAPASAAAADSCAAHAA
jgi:hypothetical protein